MYVAPTGELEPVEVVEDQIELLPGRDFDADRRPIALREAVLLHVPWSHPSAKVLHDAHALKACSPVVEILLVAALALCRIELAALQTRGKPPVENGPALRRIPERHELHVVDAGGRGLVERRREAMLGDHDVVPADLFEQRLRRGEKVDIRVGVRASLLAVVLQHVPGSGRRTSPEILHPTAGPAGP